MAHSTDVQQGSQALLHLSNVVSLEIRSLLMCRLCGGFACHSEAQAVALDVAAHGGSIPTALRLQSPCAAAQASAGELSAEMRHAHTFQGAQLTGQATCLVLLQSLQPPVQHSTPGCPLECFSRCAAC